MNYPTIISIFFTLNVVSLQKTTAQPNDTIYFHVATDHHNQSFDITINFQTVNDSVSLIFPAWTPGYYQLMNYGENVFYLGIQDVQKNITPIKKRSPALWRVPTQKPQTIIHYKVKANKNFVATSFIGTDHSYLLPASLFPIVDNNTSLPIKVSIETNIDDKIRTSLRSSNANTFIARTTDELYDSPILISSNMEELPAFNIDGKPHYFYGVQLGQFNKQEFIADLKKIVEAATQVIDHIPYDSYHFIAIGPGQGGIEHLNSTTIAFNGESLTSKTGKLQMYSFLAHEYFHHYNVKRIRPLELGPFDYTKENRTNMLWISEGITVYYDHLLLARAGLCTQAELLNSFSDLIEGFENSTGKNHQTLAEASYQTWSDGPFGKDDGKTISVYEKGALVALMLDLKIRKETHGQKSLDDVMKTLYHEFYIKKQRGFTEKEFRKTCEQIAGSNLNEIFDYVYTLKPIDYKKHLAYGGFILGEQNKYSLSVKEKLRSSESKAMASWLK